MKRFLVLFLGTLAGVSCKAHQHGLSGTEVVTIELTSGLG